MVDIAEINDCEQLAGYRQLWRSLWARTRQASFHQTLEWLECYWRHHRHQKLRVLIVTVAGKPIGIVPLVVKPVATAAGTIRVLTYPMDLGTFFGPVGPSPAATLYGAMRHLQQTPRDWDVVDLRYVDDQGLDRDRTANAMRMGHLQPYRREWSSSDTLALDGSWFDYWVRRASAHRDHVRQLEQQFAAAGRIGFTRERSSACGGDWGSQRRAQRELVHDSLERLGALLAAVPGSVADSHDRFVHDAFHTAVKAGHADLAVLTLDAAPIAAAWSFQHDGTVEIVRLATSPRWGAAALQLLLSRMIRNSFERGDGRLRFGQASGPATVPWRTTVETSYRYTHYPLVAPRAQLMRLRHVLRSWVARPPQAAAEPGANVEQPSFN